MIVIVSLPAIKKKREVAFQDASDRRRRRRPNPDMTLRFDWTTHYPSTRVPVFARNVVSTSHPLGAQAGLRMIQQGGNAVDAAIAAAAVMMLVEPCSNGLGSDAFCILWDGERLHGLNASGRPPRPGRRSTSGASTAPMPRRPPMRGWDSVTVPGRRRRLGGAVASASASCRSPTCSSRRSTSPSAATPCRSSCSRSGPRATPLARRACPAGPRPSCRAAAPPRSPSTSAFRRLRAACGDPGQPRRGALRRRDRRRPRRRIARANGGAIDGRRLRRLPAGMGRADRPRRSTATACTRSRRTGRASPR